MTTQDLMHLIGKRCSYQIANGILVEMEIKNARAIRWGKTDVLITPVAGTGEAWVEDSSVVIHEGDSV